MMELCFIGPSFYPQSTRLHHAPFVVELPKAEWYKCGRQGHLGGQDELRWTVLALTADGSVQLGGLCSFLYKKKSSLGMSRTEWSWVLWEKAGARRDCGDYMGMERRERQIRESAQNRCPPRWLFGLKWDFRGNATFCSLV